MPGYSTGQELLTLQDQAALYQPDIVVLAVYTANDVFDNHPGFSSDGTGHWNATAHRLAAALVGDRLCAGSARLKP